MVPIIRKPRARTRPNFAERSMGVVGKTPADLMAKAQDFFSNPAARTGYGTPNLAEATSYPLVRYTFNYWDLISLYEGNWIARRICDVPAQDMVRAWPKLTSDIEPEDIGKIARVIRRTNTKGNMLRAMEWARLFGGAGCLMVIKGQDKELDQPLDLDSIEIGGFKGLIPFDRWSGIYPDTNYCTDINRPMDFNLPETYRVVATGGNSFQVHASRVLRFTGPSVPTPEREAYQMWGISVLEPTIQEIQKRDNASWNILNLTFRANILGMKFPELAQLLSGLGSSQKATRDFTARMSELNHMISNQSMVPLPKDGSIESTQYSFSGLGEVYTQFCLDISGAAQIPVARLWGRTITGLGQTGDGDERIYEERIATDQDTYLRPQLEKLFPVLCASELGEVPDDLDLSFPSIRVLDEKERTELSKNIVDTVVVALNSGLISPQCAAEELAQSSDDTGVFTNMTPERIAKLSDDTQAEGELGQGLFGGGESGADPTGLNPASSPSKALKEDDRVGKAAAGIPTPPGRLGSHGGAPKDELAIPEGDDPKAQDTTDDPIARAYSILVAAYRKSGQQGSLDGFIRRVMPRRMDDILEFARSHEASRAEDAFEKIIIETYADGTCLGMWPDGQIREFQSKASALRGVKLLAKKTVKGAGVLLSEVEWRDKGGGLPSVTSAKDSDGSARKIVSTAMRAESQASEQYKSENKAHGDEWMDKGDAAEQAGDLRLAVADYTKAEEAYRRAKSLALADKAVSARVRARRAQAKDSDGSAHGGTLDVHGLRCVIETPKGGTRSGRGWTTTMPADYGYIVGVQGADGDSLDCYVGPDLESRWVYVIDQAVLSDRSKFDEHKVMLGFSSKNEALAAYRAGHHKAKDVMLDWTPMMMKDFKEWIRTGDLTKPCSSEVKL